MKIVLVGIVLAAASFLGCGKHEPRAHRSIPIADPPIKRGVVAAEMDCGEMIRRVVAGEEFTGRDLFLWGIALNDNQDGLVNLGTMETYRSRQFENFVSIYGVPRKVHAGSRPVQGQRFAFKRSEAVRWTCARDDRHEVP